MPGLTPPITGAITTWSGATGVVDGTVGGAAGVVGVAMAPGSWMSPGAVGAASSTMVSSKKEMSTSWKDRGLISSGSVRVYA